LLWATPQTQSGSAASTKASSPEASAKVLEIPKKDLPRPAAVQNPKSGTLKMESALDAEEVRIPSWLEPLARNAAIPVRTEAPAKSEPAPEQKAEKFALQEVASVAGAQEIEATKLQEPIFDEALADETTAETGSTIAKNKGILFGAIAAGVLILIAGGSWLLRRPANPVQGSSPAAATQAPAASGAAQPVTQNSAAPSVSQPNASPSSAAGTIPQAAAQSATPSPQPVSVKAPTNTNTDLLAYKQLAEPAPTPKKPALGQVRLATPMVARNARAPESIDAGAAPLIDSQLTPSADGLSNGLAAAKQPLAPPTALQTGGDVKPARMISSLAPVYPMLAKNQHIEGDVRVDALIEASGRVSAMKVVSGPPLLQQAAMDALRQWKYQPATLDGKPVPMHLTVTIQFRMK